MANVTKRDRWLIAIILTVALFGGAVAGAIAFFYQTVEKATLVLLFKDILQPLGTAFLGALYVWHDMFGEGGRSKSSAEALSQAGAEATAAPQVNVQTVIQNLPYSSSPPFDKEALARTIESLIKEKGELETGVVMTQGLVIKDKDGKPRIVLGTADEGFATAHRRKLIADDPMPHVANLREPKHDIDPFDLTEALRIINAAEGWERAFLSVLLVFFSHAGISPARRPFQRLRSLRNDQLLLGGSGFHRRRGEAHEWLRVVDTLGKSQRYR